MNSPLTGITQPYQAWVMKPDGDAEHGYTFPWSTVRFRQEPRLIPLRYSKKAGAMGDATFQVLRQYRQDETDKAHRLHAPDLVIPRCWVAITKGVAFSAETGFDVTTIEWWGFLGDLPSTRVESEDDELGEMMGYQVGKILDAVSLGSLTKLDGTNLVDDTANGHGWCQASSDGSYPVPMNSPPTANLQIKDGHVIGNAKLISGGGYDGYVFARLPEDCGTTDAQLWSRSRLMGHIIKFCKPTGLPAITLTIDSSDLATYLDSTVNPEVYELRNLKYKGALDMLFPFSQGLDWDLLLSTDGASWIVHVYSATEDADYGVPVGTIVAIDLTADEAVEVALVPSEADTPDEVVYEGGNCYWGFSVSKWNENLKLVYDGGSTLGLAYDDADDVERSKPQFEDVYTLFQLKPNANGDLRRSNTPGDTSTDDGPLFPEILWNGSTVSLTTTSRCPYLPTARLQDVIPWEAGRKSDGTDQRDDIRKAQPTYLKPKVFYWDHLLTSGFADLTDSNYINQFADGQRPEVSADDRSAALRVVFAPKHLLALGEFTGDSFEGQPIMDWTKIIVTIAGESDQRVRVAKRRVVNSKPLADDKVITRLVVRDESLCFWAMLKNTIIGVKLDDDGNIAADRITGGTAINTFGGGDTLAYAVRNDWAKVERNAQRLAAWAFRDRMSGTISLARPDTMPSWVRIGWLAGVISEPIAEGQSAPVQYTANAIIRGIEVTLGDAPRVVASLDTLPMPTFARGMGAGVSSGSASPTGGGTVSPNLGATVPQAIQHLQVRMGDAERDTQRKLIYPPLIRDPFKVVQIIGGQLIEDNDVIQYESVDPTLTQVYDPDVDTTYPSGIGRAWLVNSSGQRTKRVLVRHDFAGRQAPLEGGWVFVIHGTRTITVSSGAAAGTPMQFYLVTYPA